MRRDRSLVFLFISMFLLFSTLSYGQAWSGILASSRAINWTTAGLPATLPDGETTLNPWTPPTRTQCGATLNPSGDTTGATDTQNINAGLAACTTGHYYLLGSGQFYINGMVTMYEWSGVTLRGSGPQSTIVNFLGSGQLNLAWAMNGGGCTTVASGLSAGSTSVSVSGCSGSSPHAGDVFQITQCDTGTGGSNCGTGTIADNGGLFMCGYNVVCIRSGEGTSTGTHWQYQTAYVTNVSGSGSYTITFTPGLFLSNWSTSNNPTVNWLSGNSPTHAPYGDGIEDMTVYGTTSANPSVLGNLSASYASWVKGVRLISPQSVLMNNSTNCLVVNNYIYREIPPPGSSYGSAFSMSQSSNNLFMNNLSDIDIPWQGMGSNSGNVIAYNYGRDAFTAYVLSFFEHQAGSHMELFEGNQSSQFQEDDTHGTHDLNTWFRNHTPCYDVPYSSLNPACLMWDDFARFENSIGNVLGTAGIITTYEGTGDSGWVYRLGHGQFNDPLVKPTSMRWGNYDTVTNAVRWCGNSSDPGWSTTCGSTSEVPTNINPNAYCTGSGTPWSYCTGSGTGTGNLSTYDNPVPTSTTLPASFFLGVTGHPNGGTGLSWWKVCTSWTTFPTPCSGTSTPPFPPIGPDVTGGPYDGGYAYDIPASLAWLNLPVDTAYQTSYTITGSSWSNGTETLTVTGIPSLEHLMGAFQLAGLPGACTSGATFNANGEILITNSTSTTVGYALASNPGSNACTGANAFRWPDVRQFDERVYQQDGDLPDPPTGLNAVVQ